MIIDCDTCAVRNLECGDCVVAFLLQGAPVSQHEPAAVEPVVVELDGAEQAALAVLADSGLVPPLRLVAQADDVTPPALRRRDSA